MVRALGCFGVYLFLFVCLFAYKMIDSYTKRREVIGVTVYEFIFKKQKFKNSVADLFWHILQ